MIENPVIKGSHPDPCVCRRGEDYYLVCSSFEWLPAIPVYHSRDLKNWRLLTHIMRARTRHSLENIGASCGIVMPHLSYDAEEGLFYLVYGVMRSRSAGHIDVDNYLTTSRSIEGGWSESVYLHSAGAGASLFHDRDGRKYIVGTLTETHDAYEKPTSVCICGYDSEKKQVTGTPRRIFSGATDRGCVFSPRIYMHAGMYYLLCSEGGAGYFGCVTLARSESVTGEYVPDSHGPVLTAFPESPYERGSVDWLKPEYFSADAPLQRVGCASITDAGEGEVYMAFNVARPFLPEKRCTLGREVAVEKLFWSDDGWLRAESGSKIVGKHTDESSIGEYRHSPSEGGVFGREAIERGFVAPRRRPEEFSRFDGERLILTGGSFPSSRGGVSLLAKKLESVGCTATARMSFSPESYLHSAGLVLYYDNMNFIFLRKYYSRSRRGAALMITQVQNGVKTDFCDSSVKVDEDRALWLRVTVDGKNTQFGWAYDDGAFERIGICFDTTRLSDEFVRTGGLTGTYVGIACADELFKKHEASFSYFGVEETR